MGIRVNKMLGYGITNLVTAPDDPEAKYPTHLPADPRWNYAHYQDYWQRPEREKSLVDYLRWLEKPENGERVLEAAKREGWEFGRGLPRGENFTESTEFFLMREALKDRIERKGRAGHWTAPYSSLEWDSEFGLKDVVLFQNPCSPDWTRHDDIIDYYETGTNSGPQVIPLPNCTGIYPYDGFMGRFREPSPEVAAHLSEMTKLIRASSRSKQFEDADGAEITHMDGGHYNQLLGRWDSEAKPLLKDPDVLKHFMNDWKPRVPIGILAYMEFLDCFPNLGPDSMVNSLRPMIYVVWR